jgi:hypothetical protein
VGEEAFVTGDAETMAIGVRLGRRVGVAVSSGE